MNSIVAEKRYIASKLGVPYESLSQSYLRTQTKVTDGGVATVNNVIDFTLQTNKVLDPAPTDRLLDLNDEFVITHFTMGLKGVEVYPEEDAFATIHTSDQPVLFTGAYTEYLHKSIGSIYNGDLNFTIDRTEFIPQFPVRAFYRVGDGLNLQSGEYAANIPATDPTGAGNAIEIAGGVIVDRIPTTTTSLYGFYPCEPTKIDGRQTLDLSINLGTNVTISSDDANLFVVFEARGYLITNAND
jgi:hypothetical protein